MQNVFIEATNGPNNWGKFMVARFDEEWQRPSWVLAHCFPSEQPESPTAQVPLLATRGWSRDTIIVFDLETREGAAFRPGGFAAPDLEKHRIWVCPLFGPFLTWLYKQDLSDLSKLPAHVDLPGAPFSMQGYRRPGKKSAA